MTRRSVAATLFCHAGDVKRRVGSQVLAGAAQLVPDFGHLNPNPNRWWSIVSMLVALIKANFDYRLHDQVAE